MAVAGYNSQVYARSDSTTPGSPDKIDGIKDCTLNLPAEMLETTNFKSSAGYKTRIVGLLDSSADLSGDFIAGDTVQQLLRSSKSSGADVYFTFLGDPSATSGQQGFRIPMKVSEFTIKSTPGGLAEFTAKLVGNGTITAV